MAPGGGVQASIQLAAPAGRDQVPQRPTGAGRPCRRVGECGVVAPAGLGPAWQWGVRRPQRAQTAC